ncbi:lipopolysaccharide biosynthesis protein [Kitasatospora sp. NPDC006697]|uniref:lipopolysaccharide biosynthesis protein n=1 Tax=Kitasatospora sp. NPDC006697 TaxID=3364020 RepID=UPI0036846762
MSDRLQSIRTTARRWWPLAVAIPVGALGGAGYAVLAPPVYAANSYVVVVPVEPAESAQTTNFAQAYGRLAGQPQVLALAAAEAGKTGAELGSLVHGTTSPDAPVIEIDGSGAHPGEAVRSADAVARALVTFANGSSKETGVKLVPLAAAAEPDGPSTPSRRLDVAVGGAAGVLLGSLVLMTRRRPGAAAPASPEPAAAEPVAVAPVEEAPEPVVPAPAKQAGREGQQKKKEEPAGSAK